MKLFLAIPISIIILAATSFSAVQAATPTPTPNTTCTPIFGGGQTCLTDKSLKINKMIQTPGSKMFVDSLTSQTPLSPNQDITFRITLTNDSNAAISNITITDHFPQFVTFTSGSGTYDTDSRTLTMQIDKLNANDTRNILLTGRIGGSDIFPSDRSLVCLANQVEAKTGSKAASDNVQFCVNTGNTSAQGTTATPGSFPTFQPQATTKPQAQQNTTKGGVTVYPAPTTQTAPPTGPEMLGLIGLLPAGLSGLYLRRKTNINSD